MLNPNYFRTQSPSDVAVSHVLVEEGYGGTNDGGERGDTGEVIAAALEARNHIIDALVRGTDRELYGRGQIIILDRKSGVLCAGSDPRADGCAVPSV